MTEQESNKEKEIPETSNTKPMDSKQDVEKSNDEKIDQDFPGYPHYPAREDIMDKRTDSKQVDADVENLTNSNNKSGVGQRLSASHNNTEQARNAMTPQPGLGNDDLDLKEGTEGDVTEDDLAALNATNDEIGTPQNVTNEDINTDLDIPGSELDDANEKIGEEDEENNYYSLGGDSHENLEEDPAGGI